MKNRDGIGAEEFNDFRDDAAVTRFCPVKDSSIKRLMDLFLACTLILFLAPLIAVICLVLKFLDPGPVLFRHQRIGRDGKVFTVYKFRSMRVDATERLKKILADDPVAAAEWATYQKLRNDPRVTRVGQLLRRSSLDEIPQLLNILRGEMSVLGPRPVTPSEMKRYGASRPYYTAVRPGLIGLWQVRGRNTLTYDQRIALDVEYVRTWSIWRDIRILLEAVPVVILCRGAF